jgi:hypothetical protein
MSAKTGIVAYEDFGAIGDGVHDDLPAITEAHKYANSQGLPVKSRPEATYHLGRRALTATITTDTDWGTSRFTIDDTEVEDHRAALFEVRSRLAPEILAISQLTRDQKQLAIRPQRDCFVLVENASKPRYIRRGLNQNAGVPQQDCFILRRDGAIEGDIDWDYASVSRVVSQPIDEQPLLLKGGVFTTFANRMKQEIGYNYWGRNIEIRRSNTTVEGLTHYVVGETAVGHPYRGFLSALQCANITFRNSFFTGHKIYSTIGAAGKPVSMGSYDIHANNVVNFHMVGCQMNHLRDRTRWGVIGSNFCKNILLEDCSLSRMDTHMGVSGSYTIRRCRLGHMGLNAIGRGLLTVEDSELYGHSLITFRGDYGSTWEGDLVVRNCRWTPANGDRAWPYLIRVSNDGMHDFGYPCSMPRAVSIEGLFVNDENHPEDYSALYFFNDPDQGHDLGPEALPAAERPFPYAPCQVLTVSGLRTASGKPLRVSPNTEFAKRLVISESDVSPMPAGAVGPKPTES